MEVIRFGDLYSIPTSNGISRPSAVRGKGFHMINMGELFSHDIINEMPMERVELSSKEQAKFFVQKEDLLFARQSLVAAGAGKCSIVNDIKEPTTFESHLIRVRLDSNICCPRFYFYLFRLPYNPVKTIVNQCAQAGIRGTELKKIKVPFPALSIQKSIAAILSAYDDLIEKNNRKIAILQQMAEELYKEWFVRFRFPGHKTAKFKDGIPEGWAVDKIKERINRLPFNRLYKEFELEKEGKIIVIDQSEKEFLGFHNNEPSHIASYEDPICLFGDHSCKFHLMTQPFSLGENVVPFKGKNINSYYLFYSTHEIIKTEEYKRHWGLFVSKKILIPPMNLQKNFEKHLKLIHKQIDIIKKSNRILIKQRDLLLPRLMSGKLKVKA